MLISAVSRPTPDDSLPIGEDTSFEFKYIWDEDDASPSVSSPPKAKGRGKVIVSAGDGISFPTGTIQAMMLNVEIYKILVAAPKGTKDVILTALQDLRASKSQPGL